MSDVLDGVLLHDLMDEQEIAQFLTGNFGTAEMQVARGVRFLDREFPGWRETIDLTKFEIESSCNCVLGQLFVTEAAQTSYVGWDGYLYGTERFLSPVDVPEEAGVIGDEVAVFFGFDYWPGFTSYGELQALWEAEIAR